MGLATGKRNCIEVSSQGRVPQNHLALTPLAYCIHIPTWQVQAMHAFHSIKCLGSVGSLLPHYSWPYRSTGEESQGVLPLSHCLPSICSQINKEMAPPIITLLTFMVVTEINSIKDTSGLAKGGAGVRTHLPKFS